MHYREMSASQPSKSTATACDPDPVPGMSWEQEILMSTGQDFRSQPWKKTYEGIVDNSLESGPDHMTVCISGGDNVGSKKARDSSVAA